MKINYFVRGAIKQIENINIDLVELRKQRNQIEEQISNKVCVRDLLKKAIKFIK